MARLYTTGWEQNLDIFSGTLGTGWDPTPVGAIATLPRNATSPVLSGTYAGNCTRLTSDFGSVFYPVPTTVGTVALSTTYYARFYFRTDTLPSTATMTLGAFGANVKVVDARLTTAGKLQLFNTAAGTQIGSNSAATIATGQWYRVELSFATNASTQAATGTLMLDGVQVATGALSLTALSGGITLDMGCLTSLATGNPMVLVLDDAAINDSTGANQNTWPGSGKVVLLIPTGDSAKGTGWTNDAASSTSLFPSVDNEPPVGVADTTVGTGLHQIRNATSNASVNYDANLTTYSAAGLGAADTINVVVPLVVTGAPVVTSAKQGTVGIVSNPAITNVALDAAGTAGAFWSGIAAGTYNSGWKWSQGTATYLPSVTLGTAPVARITQVTASTRIAMVCFMGMYVDYTPGVVIPPTPLVHQSIPFYPRASRPG